ncbi:MAG: aminotransferase class IV [Myxococcales bacterium]|nr:aminotransferase class IV [Myxococcales bacterium]
MTTIVSIDGVAHAPETARVSVFDRGFLYGDSVFETIRTYGGRPFALPEHLCRLEQSAARVFIELPVPRSRIAAEVAEALAAAGNPESYVRVIVTRGSGPLGLDTGFEVRPLRVIIVAPLTPPAPELYAEGIAAVTYRTQRVAEATDAAGTKVGNYLVAVLAMRKARAEGAAEALIVDHAGNVVEGASSNVFAVCAGVLVTPPESAGILPGITRAKLLEVAAELGLPVELRALPVAELSAADEVFISSSIRELLAVVRVDSRVIGAGRPGAVSARLLRAFREKAMI